MKVELIFDADCPNIDEARGNLFGAFAKAGIEPNWIEWNRTLGSCPEYSLSYGSPSILVDGIDVAPDNRPAGNCCRLYVDSLGKVGRAPPVERILSALLSQTGI